MTQRFLVYVRRSYRPNGAPDVSDETQVDAALAMLPEGVTHEVIADSGGHHSGRNDRRDGYQEVIRRIEAGGITGLAVYDVSRLARDARTMHNLKFAMDRRHVTLLLANMPASRFDDAMGKFMFGQIVLAAELQANLDSERAVSLNRTMFEDGRHRGSPPRGYRNGKDATNRRTLEVDPDSSRRVVQIVDMLPERSFGEIARSLTLDGYPMTESAVKDVARRLRVYLGFVVRARGLDERPGKHTPLITGEQYARAIAGIRRRTHTGPRVRAHRIYLLAEMVTCQCGTKMRCETRVARGKEWSYYRCRACAAPLVPSALADGVVLDTLRALPPLARRTIERADQESNSRVVSPVAGLAAKQRERLERHMAQLRKQHAWEEINDTQFRAEMALARADLALLPDADKLVAFTKTRALIESLSELIDQGGPLDHQRLVRTVIESITARDGKVLRTDVVLASAIRDVLWRERPRTAADVLTPDANLRPEVWQ